MSERPILIWCDDRIDDTMLVHLADRIAAEAAVDVEPVRNFPELVQEMHEVEALVARGGRVVGVVLDVMFPGATDLSAFGLPQVKVIGNGHGAGMTVVKHVFRSREFSSKRQFRWDEIPILLLSVRSNFRPIAASFISENKFSDVEAIPKLADPAPGGRTWETDVIEWVKRCDKRAQRRA